MWKKLVWLFNAFEKACEVNWLKGFCFKMRTRFVLIWTEFDEKALSLTLKKGLMIQTGELWKLCVIFIEKLLSHSRKALIQFWNSHWKVCGCSMQQVEKAFV